MNINNKYIILIIILITISSCGDQESTVVPTASPTQPPTQTDAPTEITFPNCNEESTDAVVENKPDYTPPICTVGHRLDFLTGINEVNPELDYIQNELGFLNLLNENENYKSIPLSQFEDFENNKYLIGYYLNYYPPMGCDFRNHKCNNYEKTYDICQTGIGCEDYKSENKDGFIIKEDELLLNPKNNVLKGKSGSIQIWFKPDHDHKEEFSEDKSECPGYYFIWFGIEGDSDAIFTIQREHCGQILAGWWQRQKNKYSTIFLNNVRAISDYKELWKKDQITLLTFTWNENEAKLYINDELIGSTTNLQHKTDIRKNSLIRLGPNRGIIYTSVRITKDYKSSFEVYLDYKNNEKNEGFIDELSSKMFICQNHDDKFYAGSENSKSLDGSFAVCQSPDSYSYKGECKCKPKFKVLNEFKDRDFDKTINFAFIPIGYSEEELETKFVDDIYRALYNTDQNGKPFIDFQAGKKEILSIFAEARNLFYEYDSKLNNLRAREYYGNNFDKANAFIDELKEDNIRIDREFGELEKLFNNLNEKNIVDTEKECINLIRKIDRILFPRIGEGIKYIYRKPGEYYIKIDNLISFAEKPEQKEKLTNIIYSDIIDKRDSSAFEYFIFENKLADAYSLLLDLIPPNKIFEREPFKTFENNFAMFYYDGISPEIQTFIEVDINPIYYYDQNLDTCEEAPVDSGTVKRTLSTYYDTDYQLIEGIVDFFPYEDLLHTTFLLINNDEYLRSTTGKFSRILVHEKTANSLTHEAGHRFGARDQYFADEYYSKDPKSMERSNCGYATETEACKAWCGPDAVLKSPSEFDDPAGCLKRGSKHSCETDLLVCDWSNEGSCISKGSEIENDAEYCGKKGSIENCKCSNKCFWAEHYSEYFQSQCFPIPDSESENQNIVEYCDTSTCVDRGNDDCKELGCFYTCNAINLFRPTENSLMNDHRRYTHFNYPTREVIKCHMLDYLSNTLGYERKSYDNKNFYIESIGVDDDGNKVDLYCYEEFNKIREIEYSHHDFDRRYNWI